MSDTERREELLAAELAADWLRRLKNGGPDVQAAFGRWLRESPRHVREILLATAYQHALRHMKNHHCVDVDTLKARCDPTLSDMAASKIETRANSVARRIVVVAKQTAYRWGMLPERGRLKLAAVVAFLAIASLMAIAIEAVSGRTISTGPGEWQTARLADGTIVHAGPRTRLSVDMTDRERVLRLAHGEVMVYVTKDHARPFFVRTDLATARAIGTAFAVQRTDPNRVSITVKEGLVGVVREPRETRTAPTLAAGGSIVLKAGERTQVTPDGAPLRAQHVDVERELAWVGGKLVFNGTVAEVIRELNLRNRIQIELLEPAIGERRMVGVFDAADPMAFAKTLEAQLRISIVDDKRGTLMLASHRKDGARESQEPVEN